MYRRGLWPALALPGVLWLVLLFIVPFYAVLGVALGTVDPVLFQPVPIWNPLNWNVGWLTEVLGRLAPGGIWFDVEVRTIVYVLIWGILFPAFVTGLIVYAAIVGRGEGESNDEDRRFPRI